MHEVPNPIFCEKEKYRSVICWLSPESEKWSKKDESIFCLAESINANRKYIYNKVGFPEIMILLLKQVFPAISSYP